MGFSVFNEIVPKNEDSESWLYLDRKKRNAGDKDCDDEIFFRCEDDVNTEPSVRVKILDKDANRQVAGSGTGSQLKDDNSSSNNDGSSNTENGSDIQSHPSNAGSLTGEESDIQSHPTNEGSLNGEGSDIQSHPSNAGSLNGEGSDIQSHPTNEGSLNGEGSDIQSHSSNAGSLTGEESDIQSHPSNAGSLNEEGLDIQSHGANSGSSNEESSSSSNTRNTQPGSQSKPSNFKFNLFQAQKPILPTLKVPKLKDVLTILKPSVQISAGSILDTIDNFDKGSHTYASTVTAYSGTYKPTRTGQSGIGLKNNIFLIFD